jgi:hypothetical protein
MHTALPNAVPKNGCNISQPKYKEWSIRDTFLLFNPPSRKGDKLNHIIPTNLTPKRALQTVNAGPNLRCFTTVKEHYRLQMQDIISGASQQ